MTSNLRIGFDAKRYFSNRTGLGVYSRALIDHWPSVSPDDEITLFSPFTDSSSDRFRVVKSNWPVAKSLWRTVAPLKIAAARDLQIFHGLSNEIPIRSANAWGRQQPLVISTIHDVLFREFPAQYAAIDRLIYEMKTSYVSRHADHIVAISNATAQSLEENFGVSRDRMTVVQQAVSPAFFRRQEASVLKAVRMQYGLPETYALCLGSIVLRKNQLRLVDAYQHLSSNDKIPLVFAGSDHSAYANQVKKLAQSMQRNGAIYFLGSVPFEVLPSLIQGALFSVYLSLGEGFGLPVSESLCAGTPVLTSDCSSMPEAGLGMSILANPHSVDSILSGWQQILHENLNVRNKIEAEKSKLQVFYPEAHVQRMRALYLHCLSRF